MSSVEIDNEILVLSDGQLVLGTSKLILLLNLFPSLIVRVLFLFLAYISRGVVTLEQTQHEYIKVSYSEIGVTSSQRQLFINAFERNLLYDPFYGWSSTDSKLEPLRGGSLLFTTKLPGFGFENGSPGFWIQRLNH